MTISYSLELPTQRVEAATEFVSAEAIADIAQVAEASGFAAVHVTDHPAPDAKWLDHGGHHALDPFVALSFAAAATTDVRLLTNVYIAAYRNPFLGAKSIQSLQVLSGGRLIIGTAAGYLKPEFKALGIDFDNRGALLDEALDVLDKVLTGEDVAYEGTSFAARGVRLRPLDGRAADLGRRQQQACGATCGIPSSRMGAVQHLRLRNSISDRGDFNGRRVAIGHRVGHQVRGGDRPHGTVGHLLLGGKPVGRQQIGRRTACDDRKTRGDRSHLAHRRSHWSRPSGSDRPRARVRRRVHRDVRPATPSGCSARKRRH